MRSERKGIVLKHCTVEGKSVRLIEGECIRCILPWEANVGESPVWSAAERKLYWVDIQKKQIHRFDPVTRHNESFTLPDIVTCIQLRQAGGLVLTLKNQFALFHPDSGSLEPLTKVEQDQSGNRFNDGKCDPQGRFWAGTMDAKQWKAPSGHLFRMDADRNVQIVRSDVVCANGSGWSPDGKTMYHTESFRYAIYAYDFEPANGSVANRRTFATVDAGSGGFPDGMTVDAEGYVWSNIVGLGQIRRYDSAGVLERVVQMPVPRATGSTFGGDDLSRLYVTSARETMDAEQLAAAPLSGSLFEVECGIVGLPSNLFAG